MTEWERFTYLACFTAFCWGVYFFLVLKEVGEREWRRYQQRREVVALVLKLREAFARGEELRRDRRG